MKTFFNFYFLSLEFCFSHQFIPAYFPLPNSVIDGITLWHNEWLAKSGTVFAHLVQITVTHWKNYSNTGIMDYIIEVGWYGVGFIVCWNFSQKIRTKTTVTTNYIPSDSKTLKKIQFFVCKMNKNFKNYYSAILDKLDSYSFRWKCVLFIRSETVSRFRYRGNIFIWSTVFSWDKQWQVWQFQL